eukprot:gb/GEZN01001412.1/.p1 GENE.gb/GEZN01001412.1/~~gb/GEZN01001412.1/.p1  ORF type:complete len:984 (+),score=130.05 gb/GEZN01001412.1/:102-2954(+)
MVGATGDLFSRALELQLSGSTPIPVFPSISGKLYRFSFTTVFLEHEFTLPYPTFHSQTVDRFYTLYDGLLVNFAFGSQIHVGETVPQSLTLGSVFPNFGKFKFELRIGAPFTLEVQQSLPSGHPLNVGYDPAVNWHWLLPLGNPDPKPALELIDLLSGVQQGKVKYTTDARAVWLNNVLFQALDDQEHVIHSAELDLNFRVGFFNPTIDDFDVSTLNLDPVSSSQFQEVIQIGSPTFGTSIYETNIMLPTSLHAGGVKFVLTVTDIKGGQLSLTWGDTFSEQCAAFADAMAASSVSVPSLAEYFDFFSYLYPLDPNNANYLGLTTSFGPRVLVYSEENSTDYDFHKGIDIRVVAGTPIISSVSGTVAVVEEPLNGSQPEWLILKHDFCDPKPTFHGQQRSFYYTKWANLDQILVQEGDYISQGETFAQTGDFLSPCCFASSVHLELRVGSICELEYAPSEPTCPNAVEGDKFDPHVNPWFILPPPDDPCEQKLEWLTVPTAGLGGVARYTVTDKCPFFNRVELYETITVPKATVEDNPCVNKSDADGTDSQDGTDASPESSTLSPTGPGPVQPVTTVAPPPPEKAPYPTVKNKEKKKSITKDKKMTGPGRRRSTSGREAAASLHRRKATHWIVGKNSLDAKDGNDITDVFCVPPENEEESAKYVRTLYDVLDFNLRIGFDLVATQSYYEPNVSKLWVRPPDQVFSNDSTWFVDIVIPADYVKSEQAMNLAAFNIWGDAVTLDDPRLIVLYANETTSMSQVRASRGMWKLSTILLLILLVGQCVMWVVLFLKPWKRWQKQQEADDQSHVEGSIVTGSGDDASAVQTPQGLPSAIETAQEKSIDQGTEMDIDRPESLDELEADDCIGDENDQCRFVPDDGGLSIPGNGLEGEEVYSEQAEQCESPFGQEDKDEEQLPHFDQDAPRAPLEKEHFEQGAPLTPLTDPEFVRKQR